VKTLASVILVVLLTTAIGLLCWVAWARMVGVILPRIVPDSISDGAYLLIVVIALAPSWGPAALVFKWLWRRLVHQALSLKSTLAIYFVCVVSTPSLIYFSLAEPIITYEEAIALHFLIFLLAAFIVFRMHRGQSARTSRELAVE
jgi:hypothetical protein